MTGIAASLITGGTAPDGQPCVFKRLRPEHAGREGLALRLQNEHRVLVLLRDVPGVIRLLGVQDTPLTLLLEFADGGSLEQRLASGPVPRVEGLRIARELVDAVSACHALGVVHRDIKPSNLLFVGSSLRLADFGVAASGSPARALPEGWEEDEVGTPPWSAPELRHNATRQTSPAVDIYGVARTLQALIGDDVEQRPTIMAALESDPARRPRLGEIATALL